MAGPFFQWSSARGGNCGTRDGGMSGASSCLRLSAVLLPLVASLCGNLFLVTLVLQARCVVGSVVVVPVRAPAVVDRAIINVLGRAGYATVVECGAAIIDFPYRATPSAYSIFLVSVDTMVPMAASLVADVPEKVDV